MIRMLQGATKEKVELGHFPVAMTRREKASVVSVAKTRGMLGALIVVLCCNHAVTGEAYAHQFDSCEAQMLRASRDFQIPLGVLYAVATTEASHNGVLQPLALNVEGSPLFPPDLRSALEIVREALRSGVRLIDVGCMQINLKFHGDRFKSLEEMFDPRRNVDYGASYLRRLHRQEADWTRAVARYHASPGNRPAQQRYVCNVIRNMIAAGLGGWTNAARSFCER
ncbi:MAG TPA: transglycosylase SLT domain-containing protein [Beijerinckiaceae bacterium]|nr:transglycosylase SLT domain-containing protein [Beijerinckiaceae bacterium]